MARSGRRWVQQAVSGWTRRRLVRVGPRTGLPPLQVRHDVVDGVRWCSRRPAADHHRPPVGAPVVVLVHGLGTSGASLLRVAGHLAPSCEVWLPDLPGFGASDAPDHALGLQELADALVAWMDAVGIERAAALGHSLGCQVAGRVVLAHPGRFTRLVAVAPTLDPAARTVARQAARLALDGLREPVRELPWAAADYLRCGPVRMWATLREALTSPVEQLLPRLDVPVLLVRGQRDPVVPQRWVDEALALLPHARTAVVPGAAHGVNYSHPQELARVALPFLTGT